MLTTGRTGSSSGAACNKVGWWSQDCSPHQAQGGKQKSRKTEEEVGGQHPRMDHDGLQPKALPETTRDREEDDIQKFPLQNYVTRHQLYLVQHLCFNHPHYLQHNFIHVQNTILGTLYVANDLSMLFIAK